MVDTIALLHRGEGKGSQNPGRPPQRFSTDCHGWMKAEKRRMKGRNLCGCGRLWDVQHPPSPKKAKWPRFDLQRVKASQGWLARMPPLGRSLVAVLGLEISRRWTDSRP